MSKYYLSKEYIERITSVYFWAVIICGGLLIAFFLFAIGYNSLESWSFLIPLIIFSWCGFALNKQTLSRWKKFAKTDFMSIDLESDLLIIRHLGDEKSYTSEAIKNVNTHERNHVLDCISVLLSSGEKIKLRGYEKLERVLFDINNFRDNAKKY